MRAHFERGGGFLDQKNNLDSRPIRRSSTERQRRRERGAGPLTSRHCREFTVLSLWLLHHGGLARVPRVFSTAASSIKKKQIRFRNYNQLTASQILKAGRLLLPPPVRFLRLGDVEGSPSVAARSSAQVMTGWRCWRGSAEPTTPPGRWAQSLRRSKRNELKFDPTFSHKTFCHQLLASMLAVFHRLWIFK